jgi:hypothetical protein
VVAGQPGRRRLRGHRGHEPSRGWVSICAFCNRPE